MSDYKEVPIYVAAEIAREFGKDQVLIFAWDQANGYMHTTTYGTTPENKQMAAIGGDRVAAILCDIRQKVSFADFRHTDQAKAQVLAEKVLLYLGESPEHAIMTFAEDGSTFTELVELAKGVRDSRQQELPLSEQA